MGFLVEKLSVNDFNDLCVCFRNNGRTTRKTTPERLVPQLSASGTSGGQRVGANSGQLRPNPSADYRCGKF